jgi:hypothetical protein
VTEEIKAPALGDAIDCFNRGNYFDAAEMFEIISPGIVPELKVLVDSLNRIAAALHLRFERGGRQAAINLLSQAMLALEDLRPARGGIDIDRLCIELHAYTEEVRASPRDEHEGLKRRARLFLEKRRAPRINRVA